MQTTKNTSQHQQLSVVRISCTLSAVPGSNLCFFIYINEAGKVARAIEYPAGSTEAFPANVFYSYVTALLQEVSGSKNAKLPFAVKEVFNNITLQTKTGRSVSIQGLCDALSLRVDSNQQISISKEQIEYFGLEDFSSHRNKFIVYTSHKDINYQLHKDWPVMADELMHLKRYVDGLVKKAESVKERIREQRAAAASAVKHNKNRKRKTEDDAVVGANVENDVTDNEDGDNSGSSDELTGQQLRAIDLDSPRAKKTKFDDGQQLQHFLDTLAPSSSISTFGSNVASVFDIMESGGMGSGSYGAFGFGSGLPLFNSGEDQPQQQDDWNPTHMGPVSSSTPSLFLDFSVSGSSGIGSSSSLFDNLDVDGEEELLALLSPRQGHEQLVSPRHGQNFDNSLMASLFQSESTSLMSFL